MIDVNDTSTPFTADLPGSVRTLRSEASVRLSYKFLGVTLSSVTAENFIKNDTGGAGYPYLPVAYGQTESTQHAQSRDISFFQDLRAISDEDQRFRYVFGADWTNGYRAAFLGSIVILVFSALCTSRLRNFDLREAEA